MQMAIGLILGLLAGAAIGFVVRKALAEREVDSAEARAKTIMATAEREAEASKREALVEAKAEALRLRTESEADLKSRAVDLDKKEDRFAQREATLDSRAGSLDRKEQAIESKEADLVHTREQLEEQGQRVRGELERVAQMTAADARQSLINQVEDDAKRDAMVIVRDVEAQAREEADKRARKIIAIAMQRVASELTTEATVTTVTLPNEDMKGRIIGREGRNIRALRGRDRNEHRDRRHAGSRGAVLLRSDPA